MDVLSGIELIAGNVSDGESQPLVKGDNLIKCLKEMQGNIDHLNGIVDKLSTTLRAQSRALSYHTHVAPFPAGPTTVGTHAGQMIKTMINGTMSEVTAYMGKLNQFAHENKYLEPTAPRYILSRYNTTN